VPNVKKSGALTYPDPLGPSRRPVVGQTFTFTLPAYEDGTDRVFRNVGIQNSDTRELPRRKHTSFRTWRKFEIKKKNEKLSSKENLLDI